MLLRSESMTAHALAPRDFATSNTARSALPLPGSPPYSKTTLSGSAVSGGTSRDSALAPTAAADALSRVSSLDPPSDTQITARLSGNSLRRPTSAAIATLPTVSALLNAGMPITMSALPISSMRCRASAGSGWSLSPDVGTSSMGRIPAPATHSMRIAQVSPPWVAVPPSGYGGIEWVVALLADGLAERGHDVTLFATGDSRTKARLEYVFETAPGPNYINSIWHDTVHQLFVHQDPSRFDLIHQHSYWSGLVAGLVGDTPVVHTLHRDFTDEMREIYKLVADRLWFVAISENQRSLMPDLRYGGVVHNGID